MLACARAAGIDLVLGRSVPWLTGRGHLAEIVNRQAPGHIVECLADLHQMLGGRADLLVSKRLSNPPTPDLFHQPTGCVIEVDEVQHFTSARLVTLDHYPADVPLGFALADYRSLVERWRPKGDRAYPHKVSVDFPQPGGRQAQRAYNDALRDLLAPSFTGHPVIRLAVPDRSLAGLVAQLADAVSRLN